MKRTAVVVFSLTLLHATAARAQAPIGIDIGAPVTMDERGVATDTRMETLIRKLAADGVESVRLDILVKPGEDAKLEEYRKLIRNIRAWSDGKVRVIALLDRPIVALPDPKANPVLDGVEPTDASREWIDAYAEQAAFLSVELAREGVHELELVNEPNNDFDTPRHAHWCSGANYGRILAAAHARIVAARSAAGVPPAHVISGPLIVDDSWGDAGPQVTELLRYMTEAHEAGWKDGPTPFDSIGVHPYLGQEGEHGPLAAYMDGVLRAWLPELAKSAGAPGASFTVTEVGVPTKGGLERQGQVLAEALAALNRAPNVRAIFAFHTFDDGNVYGLLGWDQDGGVTHLAERPAYVAVKNAAALSVNAEGLPPPTARAKASKEPPAVPETAAIAAPKPTESRKGIVDVLGRRSP